MEGADMSERWVDDDGRCTVCGDFARDCLCEICEGCGTVARQGRMDACADCGTFTCADCADGVGCAACAVTCERCGEYVRRGDRDYATAGDWNSPLWCAACRKAGE